MLFFFADQVHHSAHGGSSIQRGCGSFDDANLGDIVDEDFGEVHIAEIAAVQRSAVHQDEVFVLPESTNLQVAFIPGAIADTQARAHFDSFRYAFAVLGLQDAAHLSDAGLRPVRDHSHRMQMILLQRIRCV